MSAKDYLNNIGCIILPRILTQVCRDPGSPSWGCCDRNWWHYKIRDFPSTILQQAGYTIALSVDALPDKRHSEEMKSLSAATCRFWNKRAQLHGAFEEYYPYEQGYPPVAFSTLSVAKLCGDGVVELSEVMPGLRVAVRQLLSRFEMEAANQQVAGTAALAVVRTIAPDLVPGSAFASLLDRTLGLQTKEGWFLEYDGPDLGYLSVTMDCLWDLFDATGDTRCHTAILEAFEYLSWFVLGPVGGAGVHNSRNTDYIVPYGIARLVFEDSYVQEKALEVLDRLYGQNNGVLHFFDGVDDRYWCHYIGHSVFRAIKILQAPDCPDIVSNGQPVVPSARSMPESGHVLIRGAVDFAPDTLISMRKGAVLTAVWPEGQMLTDCGWVILSGEKQYVSHWWSLGWKTYDQGTIAGCDGGFVSHQEHLSLPWKHMVLRIMSFFLGRRLIRLLKWLVIFKNDDGPYTFCRRISCEGAVVVVEDRISGLGAKDSLIRAPRSSKRHVASADSFHPEDFQMVSGVMVGEDIRKQGTETIVITRYEVPAVAKKGRCEQDIIKKDDVVKTQIL